MELRRLSSEPTVVDVVAEFVVGVMGVRVVGVGGAALPIGGLYAVVGAALVGTAVAIGDAAPPSTRIVQADATATAAIVIPVARRRPAPFATRTSSV
jgi:hypothetical protein